MARRSRPSLPTPRAAVRFFLFLNLGVTLLLGGWYAIQTDTRQHEVRRLVENAFAHDKHVSALEVSWDIWQLYYTDSSSGKLAPGDKAIVYGGLPRPGPEPDAPTFRVLTNQAYVVGYSDVLGNPLWAAYHVRDLGSIPRPAARPGKFETDRRTAAHVASADYANSGYDRGHMAPNYAIATHYGDEAQRETFLMSNITPQRHALNAGLWKDLELKIATNWPARYAEVWVIVGPVFGQQPKKLRGGVAVPESFFLIVVDENEGRLRTLAFLVPQETLAHADPEKFLTSIDEIQRRTGLDFLSDLEDTAERQVEQAKATRVW
jgi:endonuclease G